MHTSNILLLRGDAPSRGVFITFGYVRSVQQYPALHRQSVRPLPQPLQPLAFFTPTLAVSVGFLGAMPPGGLTAMMMATLPFFFFAIVITPRDTLQYRRCE